MNKSDNTRANTFKDILSRLKGKFLSFFLFCRLRMPLMQLLSCALLVRVSKESWLRQSFQTTSPFLMTDINHTKKIILSRNNNDKLDLLSDTRQFNCKDKSDSSVLDVYWKLYSIWALNWEMMQQLSANVMQVMTDNNCHCYPCTWRFVNKSLSEKDKHISLWQWKNLRDPLQNSIWSLDELQIDSN